MNIYGGGQDGTCKKKEKRRRDGDAWGWSCMDHTWVKQQYNMHESHNAHEEDDEMQLDKKNKCNTKMRTCWNIRWQVHNEDDK